MSGIYWIKQIAFTGEVVGLALGGLDSILVLTSLIGPLTPRDRFQGPPRAASSKRFHMLPLAAFGCVRTRSVGTRRNPPERVHTTMLS